MLSACKLPVGGDSCGFAKAQMLLGESLLSVAAHGGFAVESGWLIMFVMTARLPSNRGSCRPARGGHQ